jgi:protein-tyrosine phosphatase
MFRAVKLPNHIPGRIFLHNMLGRYGQSLIDTFHQFQQCEINRIISLASLEEIEQKSPDYFRAIIVGELPCQYECSHIPDFGVPEDRERFDVLVRAVASYVLAGESILIHCGAGIGRTGMFACCLLTDLGIPTEEALKIVHEAGSGPEKSEQEHLISWFASRI